MNTHIGNVGLVMDNAGYGTFLSDMEVKQLNQAGDTVKTIHSSQRIPARTSVQSNSHTISKLQIEEFQITIEYDYWTNDNTL